MEETHNNNNNNNNITRPISEFVVLGFDVEQPDTHIPTLLTTTLLKDLRLRRRPYAIKSSRAASRVKIDQQSDVTKSHNYQMTEAEHASQTSDYWSILTRLAASENFITTLSPYSGMGSQTLRFNEMLLCTHESEPRHNPEEQQRQLDSFQDLKSRIPIRYVLPKALSSLLLSIGLGAENSTHTSLHTLVYLFRKHTPWSPINSEFSNIKEAERCRYYTASVLIASCKNKAEIKLKKTKLFIFIIKQKGYRPKVLNALNLNSLKCSNPLFFKTFLPQRTPAWQQSSLLIKK
jgi:hypothetical protein